MNMLKKSLKLAGALAIVLGAASPLMATSASAAPYGHHEVHNSHGKYDAMRDHNHRPQVRYERHGHAPNAHSKWRDGRWGWQRDHWVWTPGIWIRF